MKIRVHAYNQMMFNVGPITQTLPEGTVFLGWGINFAYWLVQILYV